MKLGKSSKIDFAQLAQDFKGLDPNDPGAWPVAPRVAVFIALLVGVVALAWWFDWRDQGELLEKRRGEESQLRQDWITKKKLAVNLEAYKMQLDEIDRQFGALLKQLPNKAEMDSLLADINQAGLGRGLQFDLFKPGTEGVKDFYAEMPIDVRISGRYADFGAFAEDVAGMPRIVTLSNLAIEGQKDGALKMDAKAITYRYLDEEELARKRQQEKAAKAAKGGK